MKSNREKTTDPNNYNSHTLFYDLDFSRIDYGDVAFYIRQLAGSYQDVLELCCGTGRITIPLAKSRVTITGLDISCEMLDAFRQKLKAETPEIQNYITVIQADMCSFSLQKQFDCIMIPFHSFMALINDKQITDCINCIKSHLLPSGILIINIFEPFVDMSKIQNLTESKVIRSSEGKILYTKTSTNSYVDLKQQIIDYQIDYLPNPYFFKIGDTRLNYKAKYYYPAQLESLFRTNGFQTLKIFRGFEEGVIIEPNSRELTYMFQKL